MARLSLATASRQLVRADGVDEAKMVVCASVGMDGVLLESCRGSSTGARGGAGSIWAVEMVESELAGSGGDSGGIAIAAASKSSLSSSSGGSLAASRSYLNRAVAMVSLDVGSKIETVSVLAGSELISVTAVGVVAGAGVVVVA